MYQAGINVELPPTLQWVTSVPSMEPRLNHAALAPLAPALAAAPPPQVVPPTPARTCKVSNVTNSNDPKDINSRVFVGNLNTVLLSKEEVDYVFKRYGTIVALSLHKGYAFIQYKSEAEARKAVIGEDQRIYAGQQIDVNLVGEPKPTKVKRPRQPVGMDWPVMPAAQPIQGPVPIAAKRPCPGLTSPTLSPALPAQANVPQLSNQHGHVLALTNNGYINTIPAAHAPAGVPWKPVHKTDSFKRNDPDILICGSCKQSFTNVNRFISHKQTPCRRRYTCKCNGKTDHSASTENSTPRTCATCDATFTSPLKLLEHCQTQHGLSIYTQGYNKSAPQVSESASPAGISSTLSPTSDITSVISDTDPLGAGSGVEDLTSTPLENGVSVECNGSA